MERQGAAEVMPGQKGSLPDTDLLGRIGMCGVTESLRMEKTTKITEPSH